MRLFARSVTAPVPVPSIPAQPTQTDIDQLAAALVGALESQDAREVARACERVIEVAPSRAHSLCLEIFVRRRKQNLAFVILAMAARAMILEGGGWVDHGKRLTGELLYLATTRPMEEGVTSVLKELSWGNQVMVESADLMV
jgi:hypothetical protein